MKEENPELDITFLHCIIYQETLCKFVLQLDHVVKPVVKLINYIKARGLHHCQFVKFLEEIDSDHQDLLCHSHVRWLSMGKTCKRVWKLKEAISSFLELIGKADDFPELSYVEAINKKNVMLWFIHVHVHAYVVRSRRKEKNKIRLTCNKRFSNSKDSLNHTICIGIPVYSTFYFGHPYTLHVFSKKLSKHTSLVIIAIYIKPILGFEEKDSFFSKR